MASSNISRDGVRGREREGQTEYTATYIVQCDTATPGPLEALTVGRSVGPDPVPAQYASYLYGTEADLGSFAQDFDVSLRNHSEPSVYDVTVTWRPLDGSSLGSPNQYEPDPVERPARFSLEFWETSKVIAEAYNTAQITTLDGNRAANTLGPVMNSAWDLFDDPLVEEDREVVLVAQKNFETLDAVLEFHRTYNRTVNSDTWYGYTAHKAKFLNVELGEVKHENSYSYYPARIRIALSDEEWYAKIVNRGYNYLTGAGDKKPILIDNAPPTEPQLLDTNGSLLAGGTTGNTISYRTRTAVAYSGMGLGG